MSTLQTLALGAGVQSTTLALLSAEGRLPHLDAAIFADTGWEPAAVYDNLGRVEEALASAGTPLYRVSVGNIRDDVLDPERRSSPPPLYLRKPNGRRGQTRRACTRDYKARPIERQLRLVLGARTTRARVPVGNFAEHWIGFSTDEIGRVRDHRSRYARHLFPLLDLGWSRDDCRDYLAARGWGDTPKSACIGCPYHTDALWAQIKAERPEEWAQAVRFDAAIREGVPHAVATGKGLDPGVTAYLHAARVPLPLVVLNPRDDEGAVGCSPYGCRAGGLT